MEMKDNKVTKLTPAGEQADAAEWHRRYDTQQHYIKQLEDENRVVLHENETLWQLLRALFKLLVAKEKAK